MAGNAGNVKLGFFAGLGLLLAFMLGSLVQRLLGKARGARNG